MKFFTNKMTTQEISNLLFDAFCYGVDYGQLLMEEERDSEDTFDAFLCSETGRKYTIPSPQAKRRQPHSDKWREAKKESYNKFQSLLKTL